MTCHYVTDILGIFLKNQGLILNVKKINKNIARICSEILSILSMQYPTKKNLSEAKKLLTFYFRPTTKRCTGCDNRIASLWKAILLSHPVVFQGSVSGVDFTLSAFCKFWNLSIFITISILNFKNSSSRQTLIET